MRGYRSSVPDRMRLVAVRVVSNGNSSRKSGSSSSGFRRCRHLAGVDEHGGREGVQQGHYRLEPRVAQVHTVVRRQQRDPVHPHHVERVGNLGERRRDVREGNRGEGSETPGPSTLKITGIVVARARQPDRVPARGEAHAGIGYREHLRRDAEPVHEVEGALRRPGGERQTTGREQAGAQDGGAVVGRDHVSVQVDSSPGRTGRCGSVAGRTRPGRPPAGQRERPARRDRLDEPTPADAECVGRSSARRVVVCHGRPPRR